MFQIVADILLSDTGSLYWQMQQRDAHRRILNMSVNRASTICTFVSWLIYIPIGCQHPFVRNWRPSLVKTLVTGSLPHAESEHQWSITNC
jgi:hypothetical protein